MKPSNTTKSGKATDMIAYICTFPRLPCPSTNCKHDQRIADRPTAGIEALPQYHQLLVFIPGTSYAPEKGRVYCHLSHDTDAASSPYSTYEVSGMIVTIFGQLSFLSLSSTCVGEAPSSRAELLPRLTVFLLCLRPYSRSYCNDSINKYNDSAHVCDNVRRIYSNLGRRSARLDLHAICGIPVFWYQHM